MPRSPPALKSEPAAATKMRSGSDGSTAMRPVVPLLEEAACSSSVTPPSVER